MYQGADRVQECLTPRTMMLDMEDLHGLVMYGVTHFHAGDKRDPV